MKKEEITAAFEKHASSCDEQWSKLAPLSGALHLLTSGVLSSLGPDARILCVGAGTGKEISYLAERFPGWRFTAVEPAPAMLDIFRHRAEECGIASRCVFHPGYLDSLPPGEPFDGATAFMVSHFILERDHRIGFFKEIASRLRPRGLLVSADLAGDLEESDGRTFLEIWIQLLQDNGFSTEMTEKIRSAYASDVSILPISQMIEIITLAGFDPPVRFYQAAMINAWHASTPR